MMQIAVINPNSTVSMTDKAVAAARDAAPGATIIGVTCQRSPPAKQGPEDEAALARPGFMPPCCWAGGFRW